MIKKVLRALHSECRNHKHSSRFYGIFNRVLEHFPSLTHCFVKTVAVCRLDKTIIREFDFFRRLDNWRGRVAEVSRKNNCFVLSFYFYERRTENVPRVE